MKLVIHIIGYIIALLMIWYGSYTAYAFTNLDYGIASLAVGLIAMLTTMIWKGRVMAVIRIPFMLYLVVLLVTFGSFLYFFNLAPLNVSARFNLPVLMEYLIKHTDPADLKVKRPQLITKITAKVRPSKRPQEMTILEIATQSGSTEVVQLLLGSKHIESKSEELKIMNPGSIPNLLTVGQVEMAEILLAKYKEHEEVETIASSEVKDSSAESESIDPGALWNAIVVGQVDMVKLLLDKGSDPNASIAGKPGAAKEEPMLVAAITRHGSLKPWNEYEKDKSAGRRVDMSEIVKLLLEAGADPNMFFKSRFNRESNPLYEAVIRAQPKMVKLLLDYGGDAEYDVMGSPIKKTATRLKLSSKQDPDIYEPKEVKKLILESAKKYFEEDDYIEESPEISELSKSVETEQGTYSDKPLILAAIEGDNNEVESLLDGGADIEIKGNNGYTALMMAVDNNHHKVIETLLDRGAKVNAKGNYNKTAIFFASNKGNKAIVKTLLKNGADVNAKMEGGWTPLMMAVAKGHKEVIKTMLDEGADPEAKLDTGYPITTLAIDSGYPTIDKTLRSAAAARRNK